MKAERTGKNFIRKGKFWRMTVHDRLLDLLLICIFLVPLLFGLTGGTYVYAKYYSVSARQGIAIATGIYFTANYAIETTQDGEFVESLVKSDYQGGDTTFDFEIRNFENNLLFNESDVEVPYTIEFWLEDAPEGAAYTVSIGENGSNLQTLMVGEENKIVYANQSIAGGSAISNIYRVALDVEAVIGHKAVPIYVKVQTADGALINRTLKGKMILNNIDIPESSIESQMFVLPDEVEGMDPAEKFAQMKNLSGLIYEVRTVGDMAAEGATERLKLSWDPTVLQIDLFDRAYLEWVDNSKASGNNVTGPIVEANGWNSITIEALPYASVDIGFFRGADFDVKATDLGTLHTFILAEKMEKTIAE